MPKVKPKLYLNGSPQTTEEGALIFARNMKIDDDGNLVSDSGHADSEADNTFVTPNKALTTYNIIGHIVGIDNKVYLFTNDNIILEYDESTDGITKAISGYWHYGGGKITGCVSTNISGEKILTIAEHKNNGDAPLKHINLSWISVAYESMYTQAPVIPITNLHLTGTYIKTIPNGVYTFFIRYKLRKDVYTNWFPCSHPIFAGTSETVNTLQGGLKYINHHKDSAKSFVFSVNHIQSEVLSAYNGFQLGFIITHDEATDARIWKEFSKDTTTIYFDYENVKETNIDALLETTYQLYNVGNVTNHKNKLYISNYIESDLNPTLTTLASKIHVGLDSVPGDDASVRNLVFNNKSLVYNETLGFYDKYVNNSSQLNIKDKASIFIDASTLDFSISKLAKSETREKGGVCKFSIKWTLDINPDICTVYNIFNYIIGYGVFGPDFTEPYDQGIFGLTLKDSGNNLWIYGPKSDRYIPYDTNTNARHPWYDFNLTFAYGSFEEDEAGKDYCRNGVWYFKYGTNTAYIEDSSKAGWPTRNSGFSDFARSAIDNNIKSEIEGKSFFAKCYLEITSGVKSYKIGYIDDMDLDKYAGYHQRNTSPYDPVLDDGIYILNIDYATTNAMPSALKNNIKNWAIATLRSHLIGIDDTGTPILEITENGVTENIIVSNISIVFKKFEFSVNGTDVQVDSGHFCKDYSITLKTTDYISLVTFNVKQSVVSVSDTGITYNQNHTLMNQSTYAAYVHFVEENGVITNGIYLNNLIVNQPPTGNTGITRLDYYVDSLSQVDGASKYKAFFISLINIGDIIVQGFGYRKYGTTTHILNCLEVDTLLYAINDNITIVAEDSQGSLITVTTQAKYYSSGNSYPALAFGNVGYISWETSQQTSGYSSYNWNNYTLYIEITRSRTENPTDLIKATPFLPLAQTSITPITDGFYGSYLCIVKKPNFDLASGCYVSGNDVYAVDRTSSLALTEFKSYRQVQNSISYIIKSNFNLNYLSLTEDLTDRIFSIGSTSSGIKQCAKVINSAILSNIYELKSMYRDFLTKKYKVMDGDYQTVFDNTVRVSNVLSDETFNNSVFKFEADAYYNIPTDRGVIVNMFSIGNNIFVHTKGSLYKFDANQTIAASGTDITLQESEPFNAGISQILDSQYGYGGIDNKEAGCITFDSYFFYDRFSNHIFAYSGNGQIQLIDASIYKLLKFYTPKECYTLHDDINHRVLFTFKNCTNNAMFTISYNYKSRSFVSLHDLDLVNSFAGRLKPYSYKGKFCTLFDDSTWEDFEEIHADLGIYKLYGDASAMCDIHLKSIQTSPFYIAVVLFPKENLREVINSIKFIGEVVNSFAENYHEEQETVDESIDEDIDEDINEDVDEEVDEDVDTVDTGVDYDLLNIPSHGSTNPVSSLKIITDTCESNLVQGNVNDANRPSTLLDDEVIPNSLLDYKGFKHDIDAWNANYFRNILNSNDVYGYPNQPRENQTINSDNNSLIYGKYYVLIFNFIKSDKIKFEEVFINTEKY